MKKSLLSQDGDWELSYCFVLGSKISQCGWIHEQSREAGRIWAEMGWREQRGNQAVPWWELEDEAGQWEGKERL